MPAKKSYAPLVFGIILVALGGLFLARDYLDFPLLWWEGLRLLLPAFFIFVGAAKLLRHFTWSQEDLDRRPQASGLLGGLFWTSLGTLVLLDMINFLDFFETSGRFWPLLIVAFGVGKIIDFYRLQGKMRFRAGEIFGLILVFFLGMFFNLMADAHIDLLDWDVPETDRRDSRFGPRVRTHRWVGSEVVEAGDAELIQITNLYGDVKVEGVESDSVEVQWTKVVSHRNRDRAEEVAEAVRIFTERGDKTLRIGTNRQELRERDYRFRTHLTIRVPRRLQLKLINGYGDVRVTRLASSCEVENRRGEIEVLSIEGDVSLKNHHDSISARSITGNLTAENQRGGVTAEDISGDVDIATNRHTVTVEQVEGAVHVKNFHGKVRLADISGTVDVDAVGSSVNLVDVAGRATVKNSYQNVTALRLKQGLVLETSNSDQVRLNDIEGLAKVNASRAQITADNLRNGLEVTAKGTRVSATDVSGEINISTSLKRVLLANFQGPATVRNVDGEIDLRSDAKLIGNLRAESSNGRITWRCPTIRTSGSGPKLAEEECSRTSAGRRRQKPTRSWR